MKKTILLTSVALGTLGVLAIGSAFAATTTTTSGTTTSVGVFQGKGMKQGDGHMMTTLTDAEKTALESMTDEQKKAFYETKRAESEAKRTAHEAVIDKLLAGTTLTAEEETIRQEIITARAERKAREVEMQAKREQLKVVLEKKAAGTTLTTEEQALLDSMPQRGNKGGKMGGRGMMKNSTETTATSAAQ